MTSSSPFSIPTGAFKARGAAVGVSRAAELGVRGIAMPTNGNAGAAWASYAARAGLGALIAMPVDAPVITRRECVVAGAEVRRRPPVDPDDLGTERVVVDPNAIDPSGETTIAQCRSHHGTFPPAHVDA